MDCLRPGCGANVKSAGIQSKSGIAVVGFLDRYGLVILAVFVLVALPLGLDSFRLGLAAKYLCFAFPAVGIVLLWGYGGVLSLGQGVFFGLGSYMMAMFLKLESAANAESSSGTQLAAFFGTAGLPDFMAWNSVEKLPWWWEPFHHVWFMIPAILIIPAALAFLLGYANFRRRVSGVYFAIVTLSVSAIMAILIIGQQGLTGGINGITDFKTFLGMDLDNDRAKLVMYFITAVLLLCIVAAGQFILRSRLGRVLVAIRDGGDRVRFTGYDSAMFQAFVFAVGAMFTIQIGLASPALVGIVPSIEMVIYAAVGGRLSLIGAVYGAFLVNFAKTFFSENFVEYWIYFIGALFVIVVMFLPKGLAGILDYFRVRTKVER